MNNADLNAAPTATRTTRWAFANVGDTIIHDSLAHPSTGPAVIVSDIHEGGWHRITLSDGRSFDVRGSFEVIVVA